MKHTLASRAEGGLGWNPKEVDTLVNNVRFLAPADVGVSNWVRGDDGESHFSGIRIAYVKDAFIEAMAGEGLAASQADIKHKDLLAQILEPGAIKQEEFPERANALIPLAGGRQLLFLATIPVENFKVVGEKQGPADDREHVMEQEEVMTARESKLSHGPAEYFGALISSSEGSMLVPMVQANYMGNILRALLDKRPISVAEAVLEPCGPVVPSSPDGNIRYMMLPLTGLKGYGYDHQLEFTISGWKGEERPTKQDLLGEGTSKLAQQGSGLGDAEREVTTKAREQSKPQVE